MPLFKLRCSSCAAPASRLADSWRDVVALQLRCSCGAQFRRAATGPSTQKVERLDNGAMPRAVERLADAERLFKDRADAADPLAGGAGRPDPYQK